MYPNKVGRYEIKAELGRGGMATVYRAYDPMFEREVALKTLPREMMHDEQFKLRFAREAKIIARLEHAAIVPVYDVGEDGEQPYFVMRMMTGGSLSDRMKDGAFSVEETARVVLRMAAALDYAHSKGIIHRDLKPGNILFDEADDPFISDYGIAKLSQSQTNYTGSSIIGTPAYMSPEQGQGEDIDGRSDIYSLGVIVYEMLAGVVPYQANTPLGVVFKHVTEPIPHILDKNPHLPMAIEAVIEKSMAKNRNDRFTSAMDLAIALGALVRGEIPDLDRTSPVATHLRLQAFHYATQNSSNIAVKKGDIAPKSRLLIFGGIGVLILAALVWAGARLSSAAVSPNVTPTPITVTPDGLLVVVPSPIPTDIDVVTTPTVTATPSGPVLLTVGGADGIAFISSNKIWLSGIDGSNLIQLTSDINPKFDLQWLPDGKSLVYIQKECVFQLEVSTQNITQITCFKADFFEGFRVSPDGKQVAISLDRQLFVIPFDLTLLGSIHDRNGLAAVDGCLVYPAVAAKSSLWSTDGQKLALMFLLGGNDRRVAETIRVMDIHTCRSADPLILDEFPGKHFIPESYKTNQVLPSFSWDGKGMFIFNSLKRNEGYGPLYTYDMASEHENKINPINGACCYRDARISPDGKFILFVFQDLSLGADSETLAYYIPLEKIGSNTTFTPIRFPASLFADPRTHPQFALHVAPTTP